LKKINRASKILNPFTISFAITLACILMFIYGVQFFEHMELRSYDIRMTSRGTRAPTGDVVLAVIDEKSLKELGRWPWPRARIADLIKYLSQDGAAVIGFDIGFLEPDENNNVLLLHELRKQLVDANQRNPEVQRILEERIQTADNDLILANSIKESESPVILGFFFHMTPSQLEYTPTKEEMAPQIKQVQNARYPLVIYESQEMGIDPFVKAYMPQANIPLLSKVADGQGYFNMITDRDGVVRWMPLVIKCEDSLYMPLSIQSLYHALGKPPTKVMVSPYGVKGITLGNVFIPTNEKGQMLINYLGPQKTFPHYPISDILKGRIKKGTFEGKVVLVGATAIGIYDMRNTPFSPVYPGLETHATVIDNILTQGFIVKPNWSTILDIIAMIVLSLSMWIVIPRAGAMKASIFSVGMIVMYLLINTFLFWRYGYWINVVYPTVCGLAVFVALTIYKYVTEEREKKKIRSAFSFYVAPSVVNEMLKNPEKLKLGGDKMELSVLFSDIRGFTSISEKMNPEDLVNLLNEYLTEMTNIVFKNDGTLDKYMGDAVMAIYGAPLYYEDHAVKACDSALEMLKKLEELNRKWTSEGKNRLDIGIGINTGPMMVGNMGSLQRFDYTVMGDSVNLGSRLEGANKSYGTNILISEYTYEKVKDRFVCMEVDSVRVKGKALPVKIYTILGRNGEVPEKRLLAKEAFEKGLELYKAQRWDEAVSMFSLAAERDPGLKVAGIYIERCQDLKESPPGPDWDGVYVMKTK